MPIRTYRYDGTAWRSPGYPDLLPADAWIVGQDLPDATNTGHFYLTPDTTVTTSTSFNTPGVTVENTRFENWVSVTAANVRFYNCEFVGPVTHTISTDRGLVNCTSSGVVGLQFERCTFRPQTVAKGIDGIFGHDFLAFRCDFSLSEDGIGVYNPTGGLLNAVIWSNYIHDLYYVCPNTFQSDNRSHCDGIQVHGNLRTLWIAGNNFAGNIDTIQSTWSTPTFSGSTQTGGYQYYPLDHALSAMLFGVPGTIIADVTVELNWFDKAVFAYINIHPGWTAASTNFNVRNNRWGRLHAAVGDDWTISCNASVNPTITGNTYLDDGTPYNGRKNP